jgi:low density lipoprotein receptor-related protein 5/6
VEELVTGLSFPVNIVLDIAGGKMYWVDFGTSKLQRANLDGSNVEDVVPSAGRSAGLALDIGGGKVYWGDFDADTIKRANLDGSNIEVLVTGLSNPQGIALDVLAGKMYWTDDITNKIQRANLDGSNVEDLVTTGLGNPAMIALGDVPEVQPYVFAGFFSPVENPPVVNIAKAGQAIPLKWHISLNGLPVSDPSSVASFGSYPIDCGSLTGNPASAVDEYAPGSSGLQYLGDGFWQFNWKTPKSYANSCRTIVLMLQDGSVHLANFKFK